MYLCNWHMLNIFSCLPLCLFSESLQPSPSSLFIWSLLVCTDFPFLSSSKEDSKFHIVMMPSIGDRFVNNFPDKGYFRTLLVEECKILRQKDVYLKKESLCLKDFFFMLEVSFKKRRLTSRVWYMKVTEDRGL